MFFFCHSRVRDTTLALRAQIHWLSFVLFLAASLFRSGALESLRRGRGPRTLHNAQSHLPDHVRHRRFLRRPRARPRLRRAGASSVPGPSLARRSALSTRGSTRRAAVRARARLTAPALPRHPRNPDPPAQALDRVPRGRQGDLRQGGGLQVPLACDASRRRTAPSWRWPRRSACTPSARWPRRARTARASKAR